VWPDSWWSAPPGDAFAARHCRIALAHGAWSEPTCRTRHLFVSDETVVLPLTVGRVAVRSTLGRPIPCGGLAPKASRGTPSSSSPPSVNGLPCGVRWLPSRCRCSWTSGRSPRPDGAARPVRPGHVNSVVYSYRSPYLLSLGVLTTSQCARFRGRRGGRRRPRRIRCHSFFRRCRCRSTAYTQGPTLDGRPKPKTTWRRSTDTVPRPHRSGCRPRGPGLPTPAERRHAVHHSGSSPYPTAPLPIALIRRNPSAGPEPGPRVRRRREPTLGRARS